MSAITAYSSASTAGHGLFQYGDAFAATAATLSSCVTSASATRLPLVDGQTHSELIHGEIKAISGEDLPDFGYMIARRASKGLVIYDSEDRKLAVFDRKEHGHGVLDLTEQAQRVAYRASDFENAFVIAPSKSESEIDERYEMSNSARRDLFIAVTLPLLAMGVAIFVAVGGSYGYTLSASNRLDDSLKALTTLVAEQSKTQAVVNLQISTIEKNSDESSATLKKVVDQLNQLNTTLQVIKSQKEEKL